MIKRRINCLRVIASYWKLLVAFLVKKGHWLKVSASTLLGDLLANIKMGNGFFGQNLRQRSKTEKVNGSLSLLGSKFLGKLTILKFKLKLTQNTI